MKKLVKFIHNSTPYMAGETASFDPARADALVESGVAIAAHPGQQSPAPVVKPVQAPVTTVVPETPPPGGPGSPTATPHEPDKIRSVLAMAEDPDITFFVFKAAAKEHLGADTPKTKAGVIEALEALLPPVE